MWILRVGLNLKNIKPGISMGLRLSQIPDFAIGLFDFQPQLIWYLNPWLHFGGLTSGLSSIWLCTLLLDLHSCFCFLGPPGSKSIKGGLLHLALDMSTLTPPHAFPHPNTHLSPTPHDSRIPTFALHICCLSLHIHVFQRVTFTCPSA